MTPAVTFSQKPILTGQRVLLRPLGPQDVDDVMVGLTDPDMIRLTGTHTVFSREQIEQYCRTRADHDDRLDYAVLDLDTGSFLGELAITELDPDNLSCGFRIALRTSVAGRGFGTDATRLILDHVFSLGIHRVELEVYSFNPRARRVYEKVGFIREGTLRQALRWEGRWIDADVMAVLATDPR
ncbi:GNAT family N-acetyltransferase [Nakamurella sp. GG22]